MLLVLTRHATPLHAFLAQTETDASTVYVKASYSFYKANHWSPSYNTPHKSLKDLQKSF